MIDQYIQIIRIIHYNQIVGCKKKFSSSVEQKQHITRHNHRIQKKNEDEGIGSDTSTEEESDSPEKEIFIKPKSEQNPTFNVVKEQKTFGHQSN